MKHASLRLPSPVVAPWRREPDHPFDEELADLRRQALQAVAGVGLCANFLLLVGVGLADMDLGRVDVWLVTSALSGTSLAALLLARRAYGIAAGLMVLGFMAASWCAAMVYGWQQVVYALPLVVFVAPLLVGYRGALATALGSLLLISWLVVGEHALAASLFVLASAVLTWIAYRPMRTMLEWAWSGYLEQVARTQDVRARQAELAGLSKALTEAVERLEHANGALAEARRAADEARRLKDEFATAISHELRTPLNLIVGFTEAIRGEIGTSQLDQATLAEDVETIYRNACHLSDLVDDVLDLGRLDAHRLALQKDWVELGAVATAAAEAVAGLYAKAGLAVTIDVPDRLPRLYADPTRLRQVLINLLTNAVRYVERGGASISARLQENDLVVAVCDTGIGIAPEDLPYVFEGFRQPGQLSRRGGFGLGLTISKRFVEMHGGAMWVESTVGQGSTFSFSLPLTDNVAALVPEPNWGVLEGPGGDGARHRTVLVLDRETEASRVFGRYLDGHHVLSATTPEEAQRLTRAGVVGALVIANPDLADDDELVAAARKNVPNAPVLRCPLRTVSRAGRELGAAAFLTKPVSRSQLRAALRRLPVPPRRVLLVEDDEDMLRLLRRMLREIDPTCQVDEATDGAAGLARARAQPPDLVLLDLLMPGVGGHAFLRELQADPALRGVPAIVVSAASEEDHDLVSGEVLEVRRSGGLSVAELMRALRGTLDGLLPAADPTPSRAYARRLMAADGR